MVMAKATDCCAACGKAAIDDVKLKPCLHCDLVHYCSDECQQEHRETHEASFNERTAELRDELLFRQPEGSHLGDCPICFLPLPLDLKESMMFNCCSKIICHGCQCSAMDVAAAAAARTTARNFDEEVANMEFTCPFCRKPPSKNDCKRMIQIEARAAVNDPLALSIMGEVRYEEGDYENAARNWSRAAELDDANAHYHLSCYHYKGREGVAEDKKLMLYHLEEAAIAGHPDARCALARYEWQHKRYDRAVKHWIIAANLGEKESIKMLTSSYKEGHISKDDFAAALRAHQAALDEMKSPQREKAKEFFEWRKTRDE